MRSRSVAPLLLLVLAAVRLDADERAFRFDPPDGTRFVRTLTRTARLEINGMARIETTIFRARFVYRRVKSGFTLTMTPISFRYVVNERDVPSPVWDLIKGHDLRMNFNVVGKLTEVHGYDDLDGDITKDRAALSAAQDISAHLDRFPIGEGERVAWDLQLLLWLDQSAVPGKTLSFDSKEPGFTGEYVNAHAEMKVLRIQPCGAARCASTIYTMKPDVQALRQHINAQRNDDLMDITASETLEQLIEPETMLPHFERLTWQSGSEEWTAEGKSTRDVSLTAVSEFEYEAAPKRDAKPHHH